MMGTSSGLQTECIKEISDLPPSAKLVFKSLQYRGKLTQKELIKETRLNPRTVRDARKTLEEKDLVTSRVSLEDARQHVYKISTPSQTDDS